VQKWAWDGKCQGQPTSVVLHCQGWSPLSFSGLSAGRESISPGCVGGRCVGRRRDTRARVLRGSMVVRDFDFVGIAVLPSEARRGCTRCIDGHSRLPFQVVVNLGRIAASGREPVIRIPGNIAFRGVAKKVVSHATAAAPREPLTCAYEEITSGRQGGL
jgi:hypothetical protein